MFAMKLLFQQRSDSRRLDFIWTLPVVVLVCLQRHSGGVDGSSYHGNSGHHAPSSSSSLGGSPPSSMLQSCVYEDHLVTDKNWHGYLANITVSTTGRLTFEFVYPADRCCQNVLFYSEDQMAVINARMNCWQREYRLRPEDDQILRLTPRFPWSGCHMTHPNNVATYVCKGGRSFTAAVDNHRQGGGEGAGGAAGGGMGYGTRPGLDRPSTWYIAVSNCASMQGLDLQYRMEVFGHVGECRSAMHVSNMNPLSPLPAPSPHAVVVSRKPSAPPGGSGEVAAAASSSDGVADGDSSPAAGCVVQGDINTTDTWYGFVANLSLQAGGRFKFHVGFPQHLHMLNLLLYEEEDMPRLAEDTSCWHRHGVIPTQRVYDKIIELSPRAHCVLRNNSSGGGRHLSCHGERRFPGPDGRRLFIAVSNCRAAQLAVHFRFDVYGFDETDSCSAAPSSMLRFRRRLSAEFWTTAFGGGGCAWAAATTALERIWTAAVVEFPSTIGWCGAVYVAFVFAFNSDLFSGLIAS